MHVLLRCDATARGGVGHLVRCLALADAAGATGIRTTLSGRVDVAFARRLVDRSGLELVAPADDPATLARLAAELGGQLVHVDHYGPWPGLRSVLSGTGVLLSSIEDGVFGRRPADVVVDSTIGADEVPRPHDGSRTVLLGINYAPLRSAVRTARHARLASASNDQTEPRVLVVLGGTDATDATAAVVATLVATGDPVAALTVVAPPGSWDSVRAAAGPLPLTLVGPQDELPILAAQHDVVLSAAGTTVWELACVGVPTGLVMVTDNQRTGYDRSLTTGVAVGLGTVEQVRRLDPEGVQALHRLLTDAALRATLAARGRDLVDGHGADRIVDAWRWAVDPGAVLARLAVHADADLLLAWRNDPGTRASSRTTAAVDPTEHQAWLSRALQDPDRVLLVAERDRQPVGTTRFDRVGPGLWEVSITVAPEWRGHGLARQVLTAGERTWRRQTSGSARIVAFVRPGNTASTRLFTSAGYRVAPEHATAEVDAYVKDGTEG